MVELISSNPEIEITERRLVECRAAKAEISDKLSRLNAALRFVNAKLATTDLAWLHSQYLEDLIEHANDTSKKAPSPKQIEALTAEIRLLKVAAEKFSIQLWKVTAAGMIAESDELYCEARIARLRSDDANVEAALALASVRDQIGDGAIVEIEGGLAEKWLKTADALTEKAAGLRKSATEKLASLAGMTKGN